MFTTRPPNTLKSGSNRWKLAFSGSWLRGYTYYHGMTVYKVGIYSVYNLLTGCSEFDLGELLTASTSN